MKKKHRITNLDSFKQLKTLNRELVKLKAEISRVSDPKQLRGICYKLLSMNENVFQQTDSLMEDVLLEHSALIEKSRSASIDALMKGVSIGTEIGTGIGETFGSADLPLEE